MLISHSWQTLTAFGGRSFGVLRRLDVQTDKLSLCLAKLIHLTHNTCIALSINQEPL